MKRKYLIFITTFLIMVFFVIIFQCTYKPEPKTEDSPFKKIDISSYLKKEGTHTIEGDEYSIELVTTNGSTKIYLDHQMMYDAGNPFLTLDSTMYVYPNYLVYSESGFDTAIVYIYDMKDKNVIPYSYISGYDFTVESFQAKEDGISFQATKIMEDAMTVGENIVVLDSCDMINTYGEENVSGEFVKQYDPETGFSNYKEIQLTKLKDLKKYQALCQ